ncbi:MAG: helix-turn-helix transcriptional regulator [Armatimonadetes bacterium]|nr:helix-turn-helix transcriptional regulator [Armatimonadota bacterium]
MEEAILIPGSRLIAQDDGFVIYERRFSSDDPLRATDLSPSPDWIEICISLRRPDPDMPVCPRARAEAGLTYFHHHLIVSIDPQLLQRLAEADRAKLCPTVAELLERSDDERSALNIDGAALKPIVDQILEPPDVGGMALFYQAKLREILSFICFERKPIDERIDRAVAFLHQHLDNPNASKSLAQAICLSPRQTQRLFRVVLGRSPSEYLAEIRLQKAASLLASGRATVSESAIEVGYVSLSHFSKAFRAKFGLSPSEFKAARQRRAG